MRTISKTETREIAGWKVHAWCLSDFRWFGLFYKDEGGRRAFEGSIKGTWKSEEEIFTHAARELPRLGHRCSI